MCAGHRGHRRFDEALQELANLLIDLGHLHAERLGLGFGGATVPQVFEDAERDTEQYLARLDRVQDRFEPALKIRAADRFAVARAVLARAEIIGMPRGFPRGPELGKGNTFSGSLIVRYDR